MLLSGFGAMARKGGDLGSEGVFISWMKSIISFFLFLPLFLLQDLPLERIVLLSFGSKKNIWVQKNVGTEKYVGSKKNVGPKKVFGPKFF